jgi:hypothetical protein
MSTRDTSFARPRNPETPLVEPSIPGGGVDVYLT